MSGNGLVSMCFGSSRVCVEFRVRVWLVGEQVPEWAREYVFREFVGMCKFLA